MNPYLWDGTKPQYRSEAHRRRCVRLYPLLTVIVIVAVEWVCLTIGWR